MVKESNTELLIKERSKQLFFTDGRIYASVQEIADYAGVKRTLVNYYFGSKEQLFQIVFKELSEVYKNAQTDVIRSDYSVKEKASMLIERFSYFIQKYPHFSIFSSKEWHYGKTETKGLISNLSAPDINFFLNQIQVDIDNGLILSSSAQNFYIDLFSMIAYPQIMAPYYQKVFDLDAKEMEKLYKERRANILKILFKL